MGSALPLARVHSHLSDAMLSLARALDEIPNLDPVAVAEIASILTDAQRRLLKLSSYAREQDERAFPATK